ncbi:MAG: RNA polymerase sigma factor [Planctomycetota bacterium]|jgi:RNA polymerase sigma-70 factor (ECF subfamily)
MANGMLSDSELVQRCLGGEGHMYEHVIKRYERLVHGYMIRKINDVGIGQDLAQETFMLGFENLERLKDPARLKSWLMGIAANLVRDQYKRRKMAGMPENFEPEMVGANPLHSIEERERHELLYQALAKLSDRYRAVLVKRYLEGLEYQAIADDLGLSVGAVEVCMHRARKALGAVMKEFMPDEPL